MAGESMEYVVAREFTKRFGGEIVRKRDGFVIVYKRECRESGCRRILVWIRKSPISSKSVGMLRRILSRMGHDEVWLVKLYKEPDFSEEYVDLVSRVYKWEELVNTE